MTKSTRKTLIFLMLFVLLISTLALCACGPTEATDLAFTLSDDETYYVVSGIGDEQRTSFSVPSTYNGKPVKEIADGVFFRSLNLKSVVIPESITRIGKNAFGGCVSLESITVKEGNSVYHSTENCLIETATKTLVLGCKNSVIPSDGSVTSIGDYAFYLCKIDSVEIPDCVIGIGDFAFGYCTGLTSVVIPDGITRIAHSAFYNCSGLTSVTIPDSVTSIEDSAFRGCSSLADITISTSVTIIGKDAFSGCSNLTSIVISESVVNINEQAFNNCDSLIIYCEVTSQPGGWTSIWNKSGCPVVWNCKNNEVADDGNIYAVMDGIRYALKDGVATVIRQPQNIESAIIANFVEYKGENYSVTSISQHAFSGRRKLTSIEIPESVTEMGDDAFSGCVKLNKVIYAGTIDQWVQIKFGLGASNPLSGDTLLYVDNTPVKDVKLTIATEISSKAFYGYGGLVSVEMSKSVTTIGDSAFEGCGKLERIEIPSSVTIVGKRAFFGCSKLTSIEIPASVTIVGELAFYGCSEKLTIYCEAESRPGGWDAKWNNTNYDVVWGYTE